LKIKEYRKSILPNKIDNKLIIKIETTMLRDKIEADLHSTPLSP
jgi:hypothetical protein